LTKISIALESISSQIENILKVFIVFRVIERYREVLHVLKALILEVTSSFTERHLTGAVGTNGNG